MADQYLYPMKGSRERSLVLVTGNIAPQGAGAPTVTTSGRGFTVTRTGVGLFRVNFSKRYVAARRPDITVGGGLANVVRMGTFTSNDTVNNSGNSTWTFTVKADGTAAAADADIAAGANNILYAEFWFRDTGLTT